MRLPKRVPIGLIRGRYVALDKSISLLSKGSSYLLIVFFGLLGYLFAIYNELCEFRPRFLIIVGFIGLVFATIVVGSNRYQWTEAERLKFLIDTAVLLFSLHGIRRTV